MVRLAVAEDFNNGGRHGEAGYISPPLAERQLLRSTRGGVGPEWRLVRFSAVFSGAGGIASRAAPEVTPKPSGHLVATVCLRRG